MSEEEVEEKELKIEPMNGDTDKTDLKANPIPQIEEPKKNKIWLWIAVIVILLVCIAWIGLVRIYG